MKLKQNLLVALVFLGGLLPLQAFYGTIKEVTPENKEILISIVHGHLTQKISTFEPESLILTTFLPMGAGIMKGVSTKRVSKYDTYSIMTKKQVEDFAQEIGKRYDEVILAAHNTVLLKVGEDNDDETIVFSRFGGIEHKKNFIRTLMYEEPALDTDDKNDQEALLQKMNKLEMRIKALESRKPAPLNPEDMKKINTRLKILKKHLTKKEKHKPVELSYFRTVFMVIGGAMVAVGLVPVIQALVDPHMSPEAVVYESFRREQGLSRLARFRYYLALHVLLPLWFKRMKDDLKQFVDLDQKGTLSQEHSPIFFSVFGDTKVPGLFERALKLEGVKVSRDAYCQTLLELAQELQAFYGNKPETQKLQYSIRGEKRL